ncbi:MAG: hypothetical protein HZB92_00740 [Euryarchaeota archaeon]|nr:hypothetical protein [Euryarchaeota archaeon]
MAPDERAILCDGAQEIKNQRPSRPADFRRRRELEGALGLGEYVPFPSQRAPADVMFRIAVYRRVFGKHGEMLAILARTKEYVDAWKDCVLGHEGKEGTNCHRPEFRALMRDGFGRMGAFIALLESYEPDDLRDFQRALAFARVWNDLGKTISDTFYAHLAEYPAWLGMDSPETPPRDNCAECKLFDTVGPPPVAFIAFSGFFLPYAAIMPDGTPIQEGVTLHERAGDFHEAHEHAHAYVHERKDSSRAHPRCEWVEEGMAMWAAARLDGKGAPERSAFLELYDFWLVFNSMPEKDRAELFRLWCAEPERFRWGDFVRDMREAVSRHRAKNRARARWSADERLDAAPGIGEYFR